MFQSQINSRYIKHEGDRIHQGDIFRDISLIDWEYEENNIKISDLLLPYAIVMTQDCDLNSDFINRQPKEPEKHDAYLHNILLCPAYNAEKLKDGTHLDDLKLTMEYQNSERWGLIKRNNNSRYHFLERDESLQIPEAVVDFKHYYTIPRDAIYEKMNGHCIGTVSELFRESLSQRFTYYIGRIGLPDIECGQCKQTCD